MKLKFKKQLYQDIAAQSVIKCFEGQPKGNREYLYLRKKQENKIENWKQEDYEEIVCYGNNAIVLDEKELRRNIKSVQRDNGLDFTDKQGHINYSIEMETGTGKPYTYI